MSKHRPNVVVGSRREYAPNNVLPLHGAVPFTGPSAPEREYDGFRVRMKSLRYQVFARSCVRCGVKGTSWSEATRRGLPLVVAWEVLHGRSVVA